MLKESVGRAIGLEDGQGLFQPNLTDTNWQDMNSPWCIPAPEFYLKDFQAMSICHAVMTFCTEELIHDSAVNFAKGPPVSLPPQTPGNVIPF